MVILKSSVLDLFKDAHLFISARSPFARRVRLAFLEHDVPFKEEVVDLFGDVEGQCPGLVESNPLIRVPTLKLASGQEIIDSHEILGTFYSLRESSWMPRDPVRRSQVGYWSGLAVGMCELAVEYFFEMKRAEASRDAERLAEIDRLLNRAFASIEREMTIRRELPVNQLTQADLDLGSALAYLAIRYPGNWQTRYPKCVAYLNALSARPSFARTAPPPPVA